MRWIAATVAGWVRPGGARRWYGRTATARRLSRPAADPNDRLLTCYHNQHVTSDWTAVTRSLPMTAGAIGSPDTHGCTIYAHMSYEKWVDWAFEVKHHRRVYDIPNWQVGRSCQVVDKTRANFDANYAALASSAACARSVFANSPITSAELVFVLNTSLSFVVNDFWWYVHLLAALSWDFYRVSIMFQVLIRHCCPLFFLSVIQWYFWKSWSNCLEWG